MARITVIGGTGYAGGHIVAEAAQRGHSVTSISRGFPDLKRSGVNYVAGDIRNAGMLQQAVDGANVVVCALSPRGDMVGRVADVVERLAKTVRGTNVRLGVVGGAGSLLVAPNGPQLMDTPDFPTEYKAEPTEMGEALKTLKNADTAIDWFFVSPAGGFGAFAPGERTGQYRLGDDVLLTDEDGTSYISGEDLAVAIVDEIETPAHHRARFTVAY